MKNSLAIKQLTFISIMCGINILFTILNLFLPFFTLVILIGLPFASLLVKMKVSFRYIIIYFLATLASCFLIDLQTAAFYIFPSLISGLLFGFLIQKRINGFYIIIVNSLVNIVLETISIFLIQIISNVDMFDFFSKILNISITRFKELYLSIFFAIGLLQSLFSYIIIEEEIKKFKYEIDESYSLFYVLLIGNTFFNGLGFFINYLPVAYFLSSIGLFIGVFLLAYLIKAKTTFIRYSLLTSYIITFFIWISINSLVSNHSLFFNLFSLTTSLNGVILIIYMAIKKEDKSNIFNNNDFDD